MTTIIIVESAIIIALLLAVFLILSKFTIIKSETYKMTLQALSKAEKNLKENASVIKLKDIQIEFLKVAKNELYDKIHNKPHNAKGHFCKKGELKNVANN